MALARCTTEEVLGGESGEILVGDGSVSEGGYEDGSCAGPWPGGGRCRDRCDRGCPSGCGGRLAQRCRVHGSARGSLRRVGSLRRLWTVAEVGHVARWSVAEMKGLGIGGLDCSRMDLVALAIAGVAGAADGAVDGTGRGDGTGRLPVIGRFAAGPDWCEGTAVRKWSGSRPTMHCVSVNRP